MINPFLMALMEDALNLHPMNEAPGDPPEDENADDAQEEATEEQDAGGDDAGGEEENTENNNEEENQDENNDENNEENGDENGEEGEDEFSFGSDEEEDDGPNPDGLPDPDDAGEDDTGEDDAEEKNVQINILNISELDRQLLKRKILHSYQDLRTMITTFRSTIDQRETRLDPEVRERILSELLGLHSQTGTYLTTRFPLVNYEEALQTFALFTKRFNEIIQITDDKNKHDNKGTIL